MEGCQLDLQLIFCKFIACATGWLEHALKHARFTLVIVRNIGVQSLRRVLWLHTPQTTQQIERRVL
jgi:hypothetical protein